MQPWQDGSRVADFVHKKDRTNALQLLKQLHETGERVDWKGSKLLPESRQLLKWRLRLTRFQEGLPTLAYYLPKNLLRQILSYGERALLEIKKAEIDLPKEKVTLLHGDVVHHNFLVCADGRMCLIDFDLAQKGEAGDELILWLHRVLPNMNYNLLDLMDEQAHLQTIPTEKLHRLKFPNELLREWLHVLTLNEEQRDVFLDYLLPFTETALTSWPDLWYDSERCVRNKVN